MLELVASRFVGNYEIGLTKLTNMKKVSKFVGSQLSVIAKLLHQIFKEVSLDSQYFFISIKLVHEFGFSLSCINDISCTRIAIRFSR